MQSPTQTKKLTAGGWYLIGVGLIISAITMSVIAFSSMKNTIAGMQRVVMPGKATITLSIGTSTLYAEQRSLVDGKAYEVDAAFKYRCGLDEKARKLKFEEADGKVTYSIGDYAGHNAWDITVDDAGDYTLVCESEKPFVIAVGRGVGSAIVVAIIGLVPFLIGLAVIIVVHFKRRRQRKAVAIA
jgi:hypothetical protein